MASLKNSRKNVAEMVAADEAGTPVLGKPDRVADHLNNRIFFRLFQVANTLQKQAVKELGVTTVQWAVLGALSDPRPTNGMSVGTLADFLVVSRQNLDGVLKRLERDGLVERVMDSQDKRARVVQAHAGRAGVLEGAPRTYLPVLRSGRQRIQIRRPRRPRTLSQRTAALPHHRQP